MVLVPGDCPLIAPLHNLQTPIMAHTHQEPLPAWMTAGLAPCTLRSSRQTLVLQSDAGLRIRHAYCFPNRCKCTRRFAPVLLAACVKHESLQHAGVTKCSQLRGYKAATSQSMIHSMLHLATAFQLYVAQGNPRDVDRMLQPSMPTNMHVACSCNPHHLPFQNALTHSSQHSQPLPLNTVISNLNTVM